MPSPFPGMDPYLEHPNLWPDVHHRLTSEIGDLLAPLVAPGYVVNLNVRIVIDRVAVTGRPPGVVPVVPDVAVAHLPVHPEMASGSGGTAVAVTPVTLRTTNVIELEIPFRQATVEILTAEGQEVVTVIELLSPVNKRPSDDRYEQKRTEILHTGVHLLEIDLLREGQRIKVRDPLPDAPYFVFLSRGDQRFDCEVRAIRLADPLPVIPVPLLPEDPDVPLDLGAALRNIYDRALYHLRVDYTADPIPPLPEADAAWAETLLREKGLRPVS